MALWLKRLTALAALAALAVAFWLHSPWAVRYTWEGTWRPADGTQLPVLDLWRSGRGCVGMLTVAFDDRSHLQHNCKATATDWELTFTIPMRLRRPGGHYSLARKADNPDQADLFFHQDESDDQDRERAQLNEHLSRHGGKLVPSRPTPRGAFVTTLQRHPRTATRPIPQTPPSGFFLSLQEAGSAR